MSARARLAARIQALEARRTRREVLGLFALFGALGWFAGPARDTSRSMLEARAREGGDLQLHQVVLALEIAARDEPALLPEGAAAAEALALLEEALALERAKGGWGMRAVSVCKEEQLRVVKAGTQRDALARSRAHPWIPAEIVRVVELLSESHGSYALPPPEIDPKVWPGASPDAAAKGLLTWLESEREPPSPEQAAQILGSALEGMQAHDRQPACVEALVEALDPAIWALLPKLRPGASIVEMANIMAPMVLEALEARASGG